MNPLIVKMRPQQKIFYQLKRRLFLLEKQNKDLTTKNENLQILNKIIIDENKKNKVQLEEFKNINKKQVGSQIILEELTLNSKRIERKNKNKNKELERLNTRYNNAQQVLLKAINKLKQNELIQLELNEELKSAEEELRQSNEELYIQKEILEGKNRELDILNQMFERNQKVLVKSYKDLKDKESNLRSLNHQLKVNEEELKQINNNLNDQKIILEKTIDKLKSTQLQLVQKEKNASINTLAAGFAHEINNPLNFIYGGVTGLDNYLEDIDPELKSKLFPFINAIKIGVERSAEIVKLISSFKISKKGILEDCNINTIIENSIKILKSTIKKNIIFETNFAKQNLIIFAEKGQIYQLFFNILQNSEQAIENEGQIYVSTDCDDEKIIIIIEDSGKGIDSDLLSKIMDPFYTTKEPGEGYGLGLFLSNRIVKQYNGTIDLISKKNNYTQVIITLPKNI